MSTWRQDVDEFKKTLRPEGSRISTEAIKFGLFGTVGGGKSVTGGNLRGGHHATARQDRLD